MYPSAKVYRHPGRTPINGSEQAGSVWSLIDPTGEVFVAIFRSPFAEGLASLALRNEPEHWYRPGELIKCYRGFDCPANYLINVRMRTYVVRTVQ